MTSAPGGGSKLTRDDVDNALIELGFLDAEGNQVRTLDREIVERLIDMNGGPDGLDLSDKHLTGSDLSGMVLTGVRLDGALLVTVNLQGADLENASLERAKLLPTQLTDEQRKVIVGTPDYGDPVVAQESVVKAAPSVDTESTESAVNAPFSFDSESVEPLIKAPPATDAATDETAEVPETTPPLPGRTFATNDEFDGTDRLDMDKYARALARLVLMAESKPPLTIGLYGEWGSGKSALMDLIKKELDGQ